MRNSSTISVFCLLLLAACGSVPPTPTTAELKQQVTETERAFARTMAMRDHAGFTSFLAEECVFFTGPTPLRGKQQVSEWWKRFYEKAAAPFSWEPEEVEVLESGKLALSAGPVRNAQGKLIATFSSIWRQEAPGVWRIVFDKGAEVCDCPK